MFLYNHVINLAAAKWKPGLQDKYMVKTAIFPNYKKVNVAII